MAGNLPSEALLSAVRLLVAAVLLVAGTLKLRGLAGFRETVISLGTPVALAPVLACVVPGIEIVLAAGLLASGRAAWIAATATLALTLVFCAVIGMALRRPERPACNCFGAFSNEPVSTDDLQRSAFLALGALAMALESPTQFVPLVVSAEGRITLIPLFILSCFAIGVVHALMRKVRSQQFGTRVFDAIDELRGEISVGKPAMPFSLPDARGTQVSLEALCGRGLPTLLVFVDSSCASCKALYPTLERYGKALAGSVTVAIISAGRANEIAAAFGSGLLVLRDDGGKVRSLYGFTRTPSAVVVHPDGRLACAPAGGPEGIRRMLQTLGSDSLQSDQAPAPEGTSPARTTAAADL